MLRQEQYEQIAQTFQTNIAVAEWTEPLYGIHTNVAKIPDDIKVAILTRFVIQQNIYQQVIREVIRLESKYKNKRIKGSTLYEKAIDNIVARDSIVLHY